jgi:hypothetical protein
MEKDNGGVPPVMASAANASNTMDGALDAAAQRRRGQPVPTYRPIRRLGKEGLSVSESCSVRLKSRASGWS